MNRYGKSSLEKLGTCHAQLVDVCRMVIPVYDHKVIWGARGEAAQNAAFESGYSTKRWPESKHNTVPSGPSTAIDLAPWFPEPPHIRWDHEREFVYLAGHMMMAAAALGVKLRWGGDWDCDKDLYDPNKPFDLGHFELVD